ncbi:type I-E CRISPR-associated protein Cas5/CasD [Actinocorallia sp. A-T 12471]|uniref:type I-E CRISPR-associated protein Cas5/CasD n=1 Tax=Actinocorallia sp. A-T 12471 TaxID=3089813 RepID=UPI0029D0C4B1|nr:type I-E CRISPR-associated protein Cas5/CasD [Actinocorallia sp. A-T 12471]MDX6740993.1 type I-E CRISPR-associated protein Cas5/CasD [Actinocorallia sp. A-T 12471]
MTVLLVRLAGPLQSWGSAARFARRGTENAPTKSGVLGLLAAALGRSRQQDVSDLAALRFGVRVDQPGQRLRDFHTAHHADSGKAMPLSERYYLQDAVFVAGVEGDLRLLHQVHEALREPRFLPYLGRKSCPPSQPLDITPPQDKSLERALREAPWEASQWYRDKNRGAAPPLEILLETGPGETPTMTLRDLPVSFDPRHRQYALRGVSSVFADGVAHDPTSHLIPLPSRGDHDRTDG